MLILEGVKSACLQQVMRAENSQKMCLRNLPTTKLATPIENGTKAISNKSKSPSFFLIGYSV